MTHSKYQIDVFDAYENTDSNLSIVAVAGSGKSTTLAEMVKRTPHDYSILVMAFNRDIVKDLTPKMASHPMCQVKTFNSFGYGIVRQNSRPGELVEDKSDKCLAKSFNMKDRIEAKRYYQYKGSVKRLLDLFRANLITDSLTDTVIQDIADEYSVEIPVKKELDMPIYCQAVRLAYKNCLDWSIMDFRDQVFRPIHHGMPIPKFDVVFVDEDQDLDRNQAELVIQASRRLIMVGDPQQAIYRFRGAMADAVSELEKRMQATRLPLSVCYRCPTEVIQQAKTIVPAIEACDWAVQGRIETLGLVAFRKAAQEGHLVLCRCVKPLVTECLGFIREGKRAKVKGREIGEQLKALVSKISASPDQCTAEYLKELQSYYSEQSARLSKFEKEQQLIQLSDTVETLKVIAESCNTVSEMLIRIDSIFTDNPNEPGIVMMTIHKSKGLENPNVYILAPELLPHPRAKKPEDVQVEMNLKYVAITRVKFTKTEPGTLYWVKSDSAPVAPRETKTYKVGDIVTYDKEDYSIIEIKGNDLVLDSPRREITVGIEELT